MLEIEYIQGIRMESGIPTFWRMICKLAGKLIKRFGEIKGEAPYRVDPCWCDASMSHARSYMLSGPPRCLINPVELQGSVVKINAYCS